MTETGQIILNALTLMMFVGILGLFVVSRITDANIKLYNYLKHSKRRRLLELTRDYVIFPSPIRWLEYIFNDSDTKDKIILKYKKSLRNDIKLGVIIFASQVVLIVASILIVWYYGELL